MIACYRRTRLIILKNTRTLFCDTPKLSPPSQKKWIKNLLKRTKRGTTQTNNHAYEMLRIRENVRVLLISNPDIEQENKIYCSIRVGAGAEEDPDRIQGRAHLLEHVICNFGNNLSTACQVETCQLRTVFSFYDELQNFGEAFKTWSELLFSKDDLQNIYTDWEERMKLERLRVDSQFHQMRCDNQTNFGKVVEVLKLSGMNLAKLRWGNKKTLSDIGEMDDSQKNIQLMKELNAFRELYRERPLNICFYSAQKLDMHVIIRLLDVENFLQTGQATAAETIDWTKRHQSDKDFSEHFIVVQSDYDFLEFNILFPLRRQLNSKELNTLRFIADMITCETEGCLRHWLIKETNWATECYAVEHLNTFVVTVFLTTDGLKNIQQVEKAIQNYLQFLHHEWTRFSEFEYRKHSDDDALESLNSSESLAYVYFIASHYDEEKEEFDEKDLFGVPNEQEEQALISEQLIENEKRIFAINARSPKSVYEHLKTFLPNHPSEGTEPIFGAKFYIFETELFKNNIPGFSDFKLKDLRNLSSVAENYRIFAAVIKPEDVAYQSLCENYATVECAGFWTIGNSGSFSADSDMVAYSHPSNGLQIESFFNTFDALNIPGEKFNVRQKHLMSDLAEEMIDPEKFASSLLDTAVRNVHHTVKHDPVPMKYKTLKDMNAGAYNSHFQNINSKIVKVNARTNKDSYKKEWYIESINENESTNTTLLFCQTDNDSRAEHITAIMYLIVRHYHSNSTFHTMECSFECFDDVRGFVFQIRSVEKNGGCHDSKEVRNFMTKLMKEDLLKGIQENEQQYNCLKPMYDQLMKRTIMIQIIGHKEYGSSDDTFDTKFDSWYEKFKHIWED